MKMKKSHNIPISLSLTMLTTETMEHDRHGVVKIDNAKNVIVKRGHVKYSVNLLKLPHHC